MDADSPTMPQVLEPGRLGDPERSEMTVDEHRSRAETLRTELGSSCEYGQALWNQLGDVRDYLTEHTPDADAGDGAWSTWRQLYGSVASALAGERGDNGYGAQQAEVIATQRRSGA